MRRMIIALMLMFTMQSNAVAEKPRVKAFAEKFAVCLSESTTSADKIVMGTWAAFIYSNHSGIKEYVNVPPAKRNEINKKTANIINRLLYKDCEHFVSTAVLLGGKYYEYVMAYGFQSLGLSASQQLLMDPAVKNSFEQFVERMIK